MPELFGGPVPLGASFDDWPAQIMFPYMTTDIPSGSHGWGPRNSKSDRFIGLVAIDVMSYGTGGSAGVCTFSTVQTGVKFLNLNFGANVDSFSWRGLILMDYEDALQWDNTLGDCDFDMWVTAITLPQMGITI